MTELRRRTFLAGAAGAAGALSATASPAAPALAKRKAPGQVGGRLSLPYGVQTGEVSSREAILWARSSGPGRLIARVGDGRRTRALRGPWATPESDFTARLPLHGLRPGQEYVARLGFEDERGRVGEMLPATFRTADVRPRGTSFVWTGDTAGQGWGINPDFGGMIGYRAMHETRPDFFVHAGDTVYSDGPIDAQVVEPDGQIWRNVVAEGVEKVAESLDEFRGRHRYNLLDENIRAMYADVPVFAQWDDHETHNNWYPGEILTDERYTERRVDVLAERAKRAWQDYQPVEVPRGGGGFAKGGLYRKVSRGAMLDLFLLDMRSFKSPNTANTEPERTGVLGTRQTDWLIRELRRSRATWKVISADLPLGLVVGSPGAMEAIANDNAGRPLGRELELAYLLQQIKDIENVVWITADVHYCAAHHYAPERAAFTDFAPFWEFVAGPINAGTFGPGKLDATFGPEVVFQKYPARPNESPRTGNQFFGHVDIDDSGLFTASLRDLRGTVLFSQEIQPA